MSRTASHRLRAWPDRGLVLTDMDVRWDSFLLRGQPNLFDVFQVCHFLHMHGFLGVTTSPVRISDDARLLDRPAWYMVSAFLQVAEVPRFRIA